MEKMLKYDLWEVFHEVHILQQRYGIHLLNILHMIHKSVYMSEYLIGSFNEISDGLSTIIQAIIDPQKVVSLFWNG